MPTRINAPVTIPKPPPIPAKTLPPGSTDGTNNPNIVRAVLYSVAPNNQSPTTASVLVNSQMPPRAGFTLPTSGFSPCYPAGTTTLTVNGKELDPTTNPCPGPWVCDPSTNAGGSNILVDLSTKAVISQQDGTGGAIYIPNPNLIWGHTHGGGMDGDGNPLPDKVDLYTETYPPMNWDALSVVQNILDDSGNFIATDFPNQMHVVPVGQVYSGSYEQTGDATDVRTFTLQSGETFWMDWYSMNVNANTSAWGPAVFDPSGNYYWLRITGGTGTLRSYNAAAEESTDVSSLLASAGSSDDSTFHLLQLAIQQTTLGSYLIVGYVDGVQVCSETSTGGIVGATIQPGFIADDYTGVYHKTFDYHGNVTIAQMSQNPDPSTSPVLAAAPDDPTYPFELGATYDAQVSFSLTQPSGIENWCREIRLYTMPNNTPGAVPGYAPTLKAPFNINNALFECDVQFNGSGDYAAICASLQQGQMYDIWCAYVDSAGTPSAAGYIATTAKNPFNLGVQTMPASEMTTSPTFIEAFLGNPVNAGMTFDQPGSFLITDGLGYIGATTWLAEIQLVIGTGANVPSISNISVVSSVPIQGSAFYSVVWPTLGIGTTPWCGFRYLDQAGNVSKISWIAQVTNSPTAGSNLLDTIPPGLRATGPTINECSSSGPIMDGGPTYKLAVSFELSGYDFNPTWDGNINDPVVIPAWFNGINFYYRISGTNGSIQLMTLAREVPGGGYDWEGYPVLDLPMASPVDIGISYLATDGTESVINFPPEDGQHNWAALQPPGGSVTGNSNNAVNLIPDSTFSNAAFNPNDTSLTSTSWSRNNVFITPVAGNYNGGANGGSNTDPGGNNAFIVQPMHSGGNYFAWSSAFAVTPGQEYNLQCWMDCSGVWANGFLPYICIVDASSGAISSVTPISGSVAQGIQAQSATIGSTFVIPNGITSVFFVMDSGNATCNVNHAIVWSQPQMMLVDTRTTAPVGRRTPQEFVPTGPQPNTLPGATVGNPTLTLSQITDGTEPHTRMSTAVQAVITSNGLVKQSNFTAGAVNTNGQTTGVDYSTYGVTYPSLAGVNGVTGVAQATITPGESENGNYQIGLIYGTGSDGYGAIYNPNTGVFAIQGYGGRFGGGSDLVGVAVGSNFGPHNIKLAVQQQSPMTITAMLDGQQITATGGGIVPNPQIMVQTSGNTGKLQNFSFEMSGKNVTIPGGLLVASSGFAQQGSMMPAVSNFTLHGTMRSLALGGDYLFGTSSSEGDFFTITTADGTQQQAPYGLTPLANYSSTQVLGGGSSTPAQGTGGNVYLTAVYKTVAQQVAYYFTDQALTAAQVNLLIGDGNICLCSVQLCGTVPSSGNGSATSPGSGSTYTSGGISGGYGYIGVHQGPPNE